MMDKYIKSHEGLEYKRNGTCKHTTMQKNGQSQKVKEKKKV